MVQIHRCRLLAIINQRYKPPSHPPIWGKAMQLNLQKYQQIVRYPLRDSLSA